MIVSACDNKLIKNIFFFENFILKIHLLPTKFNIFFIILDVYLYWVMNLWI